VLMCALGAVGTAAAAAVAAVRPQATEASRGTVSERACHSWLSTNQVPGSYLDLLTDWRALPDDIAGMTSDELAGLSSSSQIDSRIHAPRDGTSAEMPVQ